MERYETPAELLARLRLGREEFCQRLLTTLILGAPYPKWNTRSRASAEGTAFLRDLHDLSFGSGWPGDEFWFVDEFELPARTPGEKGGYPDYALVWDETLWIIELKTERGSHRADQIPYYLELAHHHHPRSALDFTYVTGPGSNSGSADGPGERFAHLEWADLLPLVDRHWPDPVLPGQHDVVSGLRATIEGLGTPSKDWRQMHAQLYGTAPLEPIPMNDVADQGLDLASETAKDGEQRALEYEARSLEELHELRLEIRERLAASPAGDERRRVLPWVWRWQSRGQPLTDAGQRVGYELRFSRYETPQY